MHMKYINQFSTEYIKFVGQKNINNLDPFSTKVRADTLAIMAEIACMYNKPVKELFPKLDKASIYNTNYTHCCEGYEIRLDLETVPCSLGWRFAYANNPDFSDGWCECLASINNTSMRKTYSEVGELFGINATSPHLSHAQVCSEMRFCPHVKTGCKDWSFGDGFESGGEDYSKIDEYDFLGAQGFSLFKVFMFESGNGQEIQLPFTYWDRKKQHASKWLSTPNLMLANYTKPYPLSALDLIEKHSNAPILITEDLPVVFAINRLQEEAYEAFGETVAVSWFGGIEAFKDVDLSPLEGRDIIYSPAASRESFLAAIDVLEACKKAKANSFSVVPSPIYRFDFCGQLADSQIEDSFERYLVENGVALPDCTSEILEKLVTGSLSLTSYKRLLNKVGLTQEVSITESGLSMPYDPEIDEISAPRTIDNLITPDHITAICGPTEIGKSIDVLTRAHSLAYGYEIFGFEIEKTRNVYLIDGEVGITKLSKARAQLDHIYCPDIDMTDDDMRLRLDWFSSLGYLAEDGEPCIDLTSQYWQAKFESKVPKGGVLFIDNLKTLAPEALKANSSAFRDLVNWFRKLGKKKGVSVVFCHHTDSAGNNASDNRDIERLVHNLIMLSPVADKAAKIGAEFIGRYQKCKPFPGLSGKEYYAYLPYNEEDPLSGGQWVFEYLDTPKIGPSNAKGLYKGKAKSKHQEDRFDKIREYLSTQGELVKRKEIAEAINENSETVAKDLSMLVGLKLIAREGKGGGAQYRACD